MSEELLYINCLIIIFYLDKMVCSNYEEFVIVSSYFFVEMIFDYYKV